MSRLPLTHLLLVMVLLTVASGCDNTLEPVDKDTGIFAIYGFLDLHKKVHYIRIRNLNVPFTKEATDAIDATVTLHNRTLGTSARLKSERRDHQEVYQHNFVFEDSVYADHKYVLNVERSDGITVEATTRTPTMPEPVAEPLNQNCFVPIEFSLEPMNGGTVVLRFGLGPTENDRWGRPHVLKPEENHSPGKATFTFTPQDQVIDILIGSNPDRRCGDHLTTGNIYISYIHFAPGFHEQTAPENFDVFDSTSKFGALYYDTLAVPVDTSPVCLQDC